MTPKLETLADMVHGWTYRVASPVKSPWLQRRFEDGALDLRMALRRARRFTLDDAFVREVVRRASTSPPEKMLAVSDLANLPFEKVFIEYDNGTRIRAQKAAGTMRFESDIKDEDRGTAGWLIERYHAHTPGHWKATYFSFADQHSFNQQDWVVGSAQYVINLDGQSPVPPGVTMTKSLAEMTQGYPWGYAVQIDDSEDFAFVANEELSRRGIGLPEDRFFAPLMKYGIEQPPGYHEQIIRLLGAALHEGRGDLRFLCNMLAMLNHVPTTYVHRPAKGHFRARLRNVPYLDNRVISIHCGRKRIVNVVDGSIKDALGARHNKRHSVRGFWRDVEYGRARGCEHEPIERDGDYCLCGKCGHLLRWIDHHERGDAALGWVTHDYDVRR